MGKQAIILNVYRRLLSESRTRSLRLGAPWHYKSWIRIASVKDQDFVYASGGDIKGQWLSKPFPSHTCPGSSPVSVLIKLSQIRLD